jgi:hypothetical protein
MENVVRQPKGFLEHTVCPKEWRTTPDITGSYELDGAIMHNANRDVPERLAMYLRSNQGQNYGPRSAYSGYSGYSGDE